MEPGGLKSPSIPHFQRGRKIPSISQLTQMKVSWALLPYAELGKNLVQNFVGYSPARHPVEGVEGSAQIQGDAFVGFAGMGGLPCRGEGIGGFPKERDVALDQERGAFPGLPSARGRRGVR
jgi:hypothetical protein